MTQLRCERFVGDDYGVIALIGDIDLNTTDPIRRAALEMVGGAHTPVLVVDCSRLTFVDSTGIGMLVGLHKRLAMTGGQLILANVAGPCAEVLRLTGLDAVLDIHWMDGEPASPWLDAANVDAMRDTLGVVAPAITADAAAGPLSFG